MRDVCIVGRQQPKGMDVSVCAAIPLAATYCVVPATRLASGMQLLVTASLWVLFVLSSSDRAASAHVCVIRCVVEDQTAMGAGDHGTRGHPAHRGDS